MPFCKMGLALTVGRRASLLDDSDVFPRRATVEARLRGVRRPFGCEEIALASGRYALEMCQYREHGSLFVGESVWRVEHCGRSFSPSMSLT